MMVDGIPQESTFLGECPRYQLNNVQHFLTCSRGWYQMHHWPLLYNGVIRRHDITTMYKRWWKAVVTVRWTTFGHFMAELWVWVTGMWPRNYHWEVRNRVENEQIGIRKCKSYSMACTMMCLTQWMRSAVRLQCVAWYYVSTETAFNTAA